MKSWSGLVGLALGVAVAGACAARNDKDDGNESVTGVGGPDSGDGADSSLAAEPDGSTELHVDGGVPETGGSACETAKAHKSSIGCDYYSVEPGSFNDDAAGDCFAAFVSNTSTKDVSIEVSFNGKVLDLAGLARIPSGSGSAITYAPLPGGKLPPGQTAILFLMNHGDSSVYHWVGCPAGVTAGVTMERTTSSYTAIFNAFHITTSEPVVMYDMFPYGGAAGMLTSATLLLPTSAWDTNYVAVDAFKAVLDEFPHDPFIQITAAQAGTKVTITPTAAIKGGVGIAPTGKGVPHTYDLDAGQVLQFKQRDELNGSIIESNNPVGVWGGHASMQIDVNNSAADSAHQQLFPVRAMGSEYVAVKHRDRTTIEEKPPWRLVGAVSGTTLTYTPPVPGAPTTIGKGELVEFKAAGPFVVKSQDPQHPFYFGGHMTGQSSEGTNFTTGDPEWVNVVPPKQYMDKYIFMTDPTIGNTNLVVVRRKATDGTFKDVSLDCLSAPLSGWQPIGTDYEYTRVDLATGNGVGAGVNGCGNGMHEMHSAEPFGLTVWGFDVFVSYAYPAGAKVEFINDIVIH